MRKLWKMLVATTMLFGMIIIGNPIKKVEAVAWDSTTKTGDYSYTLAATPATAQGSTNYTWNSLAWVLTRSKTAYNGYTASSGWQFASTNASYDGIVITLATSAYASKVSSIKLGVGSTGSRNITVKATVGSTTITDSITLATTGVIEEISLDFNTPASGNISIEITKENSRAGYLKNISIIAGTDTLDNIEDVDTMASLGFGYTTDDSTVENTAVLSSSVTNSTALTIATNNHATSLKLDPTIFTVKSFIEENTTTTPTAMNNGHIRTYFGSRSGLTIATNNNEVIRSIKINTYTGSSPAYGPLNIKDSKDNLIDTYTSSSTNTFQIININDTYFKIQNNHTANVYFASIEITYMESAATYSFNDVKLRFGCTIPEEIYEGLNNVTGYGIEITKAGSTDVLDIDNATIVDNGETYTFAGVLNGIPVTKDGLTSNLTARCYVIVDGTRVYLQAKTVSVKSVVDTYIAGNFGFDADQLNVLKALQAYIATL